MDLPFDQEVDHGFVLDRPDAVSDTAHPEPFHHLADAVCARRLAGMGRGWDAALRRRSENRNMRIE